MKFYTWVISCKNSTVKSLLYSISAEKYPNVKMDFKTENGLMILDHCRNSKERSAGIEGCVCFFFFL